MKEGERITQERKDELYDLMIAWICDHIPNDEDLFLTLHGYFGMTQDELHDHCIESLDKYFQEEDVGMVGQDNQKEAPDSEIVFSM